MLLTNQGSRRQLTEQLKICFEANENLWGATEAVVRALRALNAAFRGKVSAGPGGLAVRIPTSTTLNTETLSQITQTRE